MQTVSIEKGYDPRIAGSPGPAIFQAQRPAEVAVVPGHIPLVRPKLQVAVGDRVKIGSLLYTDKDRPRLRFLSPGAGRVSAIHLGQRRSVLEIIVCLDDQEAEESFTRIDAARLAAMEAADLVNLIVAGGLWPLIRSLPFRVVAPMDQPPPAILVSLDNREPFHPAPAVYLDGNWQWFTFGLDVLKRLCPAVIVAGRQEDATLAGRLTDTVTHWIDGPYPADDPAVICYRTKRRHTDNTSWFVWGQDVILLGRLLAQGRYPVARTVAVAGTAAARTGHCRTRLGVALAHLSPSFADGLTVRHIAGGLFTGRDAGPAGHLGLCETGVSLIPETGSREFLALLSPGWSKPTVSRSFLSRFNPRALPVDCYCHGGRRACIGCMACARICPVDLLPQFIYKAILAEDVENYLAHGLLDCVECGLCSYVCPAKIDLAAAFKAARQACYRERA